MRYVASFPSSHDHCLSSCLISHQPFSGPRTRRSAIFFFPRLPQLPYCHQAYLPKAQFSVAWGRTCNPETRYFTWINADFRVHALGPELRDPDNMGSLLTQEKPLWKQNGVGLWDTIDQGWGRQMFFHPNCVAPGLPWCWCPNQQRGQKPPDGSLDVAWRGKFEPELEVVYVMLLLWCSVG